MVENVIDEFGACLSEEPRVSNRSPNIRGSNLLYTFFHHAGNSILQNFKLVFKRKNLMTIHLAPFMICL